MLVLDRSGSMETAFGGGTRWTTLRSTLSATLPTLGEEVEVGKRVRRIGQVEFGKERQTRTQRVTGQTRREELEFDEEPYGGSAT